MATFKGFNTINQSKKFGLNDYELIKRDLLNAFLIRLGSVPGNPEVGTNIWDYIFDPMDDTLYRIIETEIKRIIALDPRVKLVSLELQKSDYDIIANARLEVQPNVTTENLSLLFNKDTSLAYIL